MPTEAKRVTTHRPEGRLVLADVVAWLVVDGLLRAEDAGGIIYN